MKNKRGSSLIATLVAIGLFIGIVYFLHTYYPDHNFVKWIDIAGILSVVVRSLIIFGFAFIMLRMLGKRQLSQLTFMELLIIIAFGSAVGDVMIYTEETSALINSIIAVGFITVIVILINKLIAKNVYFGRLIEGRSTVLVRNGKILKDALIKENMNEEELKAELREHNVRTISGLQEVILEPTGRLSIRRKRFVK